jgi:Protein of unknown function (DUF3341)
MNPQQPLYGLMAEFADPQSLVDATKKTYEEGYRKIDAYTPFPIEELSEAIGFHKDHLPLIVLIGGILGLIGGVSLLYYTSVIDYPMNIGGKPTWSWQSFVPIIFECTILAAGLSAVFGLLALNGLPQPYHPVFNLKRFALASKDRFFLCIEANDPKFDREKTWRFLDTLQPRHVAEVEND